MLLKEVLLFVGGLLVHVGHEVVIFRELGLLDWHLLLLIVLLRLRLRPPQIDQIIPLQLDKIISLLHMYQILIIKWCHSR